MTSPIAIASRDSGSERVVHALVEPLGQLRDQRQRHRVEQRVDLVVVGLLGRTVRPAEPGRRHRQREVVVDVRVEAEEEVAGRGDPAVPRRVEGDLPGPRHRGRVGVRGPGVERAQVVLGEHGDRVVGPARIGVVAGLPGAPGVRLGHPQVGQREQRLVRAASHQRLGPALHLPHDRVDALHLARDADVGAAGIKPSVRPGNSAVQSRSSGSAPARCWVVDTPATVATAASMTATAAARTRTPSTGHLLRRSDLCSTGSAP